MTTIGLLVTINRRTMRVTDNKNCSNRSNSYLEYRGISSTLDDISRSRAALCASARLSVAQTRDKLCTVYTLLHRSGSRGFISSSMSAETLARGGCCFVAGAARRVSAITFALRFLFSRESTRLLAREIAVRHKSLREANKNEREFLRQVSALPPRRYFCHYVYTHVFFGPLSLSLSLSLSVHVVTTAEEALRTIPFSRIHTTRRRRRRRSTRKLVSRSSSKTGSRFSSVRKDPSLPIYLTSRVADASYRIAFGLGQRSSICLTGKMESRSHRASVSLSVSIARN